MENTQSTKSTRSEENKDINEGAENLSEEVKKLYSKMKQPGLFREQKKDPLTLNNEAAFDSIQQADVYQDKTIDDEGKMRKVSCYDVYIIHFINIYNDKRYTLINR